MIVSLYIWDKVVHLLIVTAIVVSLLGGKVGNYS